MAVSGQMDELSGRIMQDAKALKESGKYTDEEIKFFTDFIHRNRDAELNILKYREKSKKPENELLEIAYDRAYKGILKEIQERRARAAAQKKADEEKKAKEAMEAAKEANRLKLVDITSDDNKKCFEKFGNNFFILSDGASQVCNGVMLELPTFSMSTKWSESPAASMAEALLKYVNKPEFEFLATKDNAQSNYKVLRRSGNLTSKTYESTDSISFEIKFRCYSGQPFGDCSLSTISQWKQLLNKSVIKELDTENIVSNIIGNLEAVGDAAVKQSFDIIGDIKSTLKGIEVDNSKTEDSLKWAVGDFEIIVIHNVFQNHSCKDRNKDFYYFVADIKHVPYDKVYRPSFDLGQYDSITFEALRKKVDSWIQDKVNTHNAKVEKTEVERKKYAEEQLENVEKKITNNQLRIINSDDKFGSQLYNLRIYPFIFKEPLIVYISSWTITPSKEWNEIMGRYYYYDVSLSCSMDQVPSSMTWMSMFYENNN